LIAADDCFHDLRARSPILTRFDSRPHEAVTHDGKYFLLRQPVGATPRAITVIVNWSEKVEQ
jgi:hypothetical protein